MLLKLAGSRLDYPVTYELADGETIQASAWAVAPVEAGGLVVVDGSKSIAGATARCLVEGGLAGHLYNLQNVVTTDQGRALKTVLTVRVAPAVSTDIPGGVDVVNLTLAVIDATDTLTAAAAARITGSLNVVDANDTLSASLVVTQPGSFSLNVVDGNDMLTASAAVRIAGSLNVTDAEDSITASIGEAVGGAAIGSVGATGSIYEGFKLVAGDDFNAMPTRWYATNPTGKYGHSSPAVGFRRTSGATTADQMMYIDPAYRGARSQSPTALGYDRVAVSGGELVLTASAPEAGIASFLPTDQYTGSNGNGSGGPLLLSGTLKTWPQFMLSAQADFIVDAVITLDVGAAAGYWPSYWTTTIFWPDGQELDILEGKKASDGTSTNSMNINGSTTDGGGNVSVPLGNVSWPNNRPVRVVGRKIGNTITIYDDAQVQGTLAQRVTYTNARVARFTGAHDIRLDLAVSTGWDGSTFNAAQWPKTVKFDYWRAWVPETASSGVSDITVLPAVQTTPGGSWAATLPAVSTLSGGRAGIEQVSAAFDNFDSPGQATRANRLPGGMTVNQSTREVSGTVPAGDGGRTFLLLTYAFNDGSPAARALLPFDVAPAVKTMFGDTSKGYGEAVNLFIAYTDFHSGNLGPHTYTVTKTGGSWLAVSYGADNQSVTITGTTPSADETVTLEVACTNSVGQTTTVTRTVTVANASFNPAAWSDAIEWWDASDNTTAFSNSTATTQAVAGSSVVQVLVGKKLGAWLSNTTAGTQPDYVLDANGKKAIDFDRAAVDRLAGTNTTVINNFTGNDNAYAIIGRFKRGPAGVSATPVAVSRTSGQSEYIRHFFGGGNTVGVNRQIVSSATQVLSASAPVAADQWYTVSWIFSGTTITVRVDGTVVIDNVACDSATMTLDTISIGALFEFGTGWVAASAFDGRFGEMIVCNGLATSDPNIAAAEAYLAAKWPN